MQKRKFLWISVLMSCLFLLPACTNGHSLEYVEGIEPTCTEEGRTAHWACRDCGKLFSDEAGREELSDPIRPATGHTFRETTEEPTCTRTGVKKRVCSVCGTEENTETLPALGHLFGGYHRTKAPLCTETGEEERVCVRCHAVEKRTIPKLNHAWSKENVCENCHLVCEPSEFSYRSISDGQGYEIVSLDRDETTITIPCYYQGQPVLSIANEVFERKSEIEQVEIYAELLSVGQRAFHSCYRLKEISLPDSVTRIGAYAFYGCSGMVRLSLGKDLREIGTSAFWNCCNLTEIEVNEENETFSGEGNCLVKRSSGVLLLGCAGSEIPKTVQEIGDYAFFQNAGLREIVLPAGIVRIGDGAFSGCSGLERIVYEGKIAEWNAIVKGQNWLGKREMTIFCSDGEVSAQ